MDALYEKLIEAGLPLVGEAVKAFIVAATAPSVTPEQRAEIDRELADEMTAAHERVMTRDDAEKQRNAEAMEYAAKKFGVADDGPGEEKTTVAKPEPTE